MQNDALHREGLKGNKSPGSMEAGSNTGIVRLSPLYGIPAILSVNTFIFKCSFVPT